MTYQHHGRSFGSVGRNVPKAYRPATTRDLEWAAGFLEGEGSFSHGPRNAVGVCVYQVNPDPLIRLIEIFGGRAILRPERGNKSPIWVWQVSGPRARDVMMTLYSLLSLKRQEQIEAALGVA